MRSRRAARLTPWPQVAGVAHVRVRFMEQIVATIATIIALVIPTILWVDGKVYPPIK